MSDITTESFPGEVVVKGRPFPDMAQVKIPVSGKIGCGFGCQPLLHTLVNIPVRSIYRDVSGLVTMLLEKRSELVALLNRVALLEERKAVELLEVRVMLDQRLCSQNVLLVLLNADPRRVIIEMRVRMVGDDVPGPIPIRQELPALLLAHKLAHDKQCDLSPSARAASRAARDYAPQPSCAACRPNENRPS